MRNIFLCIFMTLFKLDIRNISTPPCTFMTLFKLDIRNISTPSFTFMTLLKLDIRDISTPSCTFYDPFEIRHQKYLHTISLVVTFSFVFSFSFKNIPFVLHYFFKNYCVYIFQVYLKITFNLYHVKNSRSIHTAIDWFIYDKTFCWKNFLIDWSWKIWQTVVTRGRGKVIFDAGAVKK